MPAQPTSFSKPAAVCAMVSAMLAVGMLAPAPAAAESTPWATVMQENGVPYIPLDDLRSFYKFSPLSTGRGDKVGVSGGGFPIIFTPGTTRVTIGGYECRLVHPAAKRENGDLLISQVDAVKLLDPILRPTYITPRRVFRTVIIDPGHGGGDDGNCANDLREADLTMRTALALRKALLERGYKVVITREQNRSVSDQRRVETVREADAPIYISLHANSGRSDISGIETYCMQPAAPSGRTRPGNACDSANIALAFCLHTSLISATGAVDGGCRRARYSLLSSVPCPAALVGIGYISNQDEAAQLASDDYISKLATAMADGIGTFAKALGPDARIPYTTAPVDTTTPPDPYQADAPAPKPPTTTPANNKNKKTAKPKPAPTKGKSTATKGKPAKGKR